MKNLNKLFFTLAVTFSFVLVAQEDTEGEPTTIQGLLQLVEQGRISEQSVNAQREADFLANKNQQAAKLAAEKRELARQERIADELETEYKKNDAILVVKEAAYKKELGSLVELFGHLQSSAGEASALFADSLTSAQYGRDRETFLNNLSSKMSSATELPTIRELEGLWYELQREMVAGSEVVSFNEKLSKADVGEVVKFGVDPTGPVGGSLLANLIQNPSLMERVNQGREVGYIIIFVGIFGIAIAFWKLFTLYTMGVAVAKQAKSKTHDKSNPLGRVLAVGEEHMGKDIETLELRLAEAIMAERPAIERGIPVVKIISVVAPLAGLLGTVTGMIVTFQQITLFGTGDPKIMAGGISQALVTTVLGLVVAIPTTLLHSFANSSARGIINVLEEQSTGIVAEHSDSK